VKTRPIKYLQRSQILHIADDNKKNISKEVWETSPWTRGLMISRKKEKEFISFEPIPGKIFSAIASGATPIGSAERAPDRK
jgi:hypothetical protein